MLNSSSRKLRVWVSLWLGISVTVLAAQEPWQQIWQMPGSFCWNSNFDFGGIIGPGAGEDRFDIDQDGLPEIVTVGPSQAMLQIFFSSTAQSELLEPNMILNDTIAWLWLGAIHMPGGGSTGLKDMLWAQRSGNNIIGILIGLIDLPGDQVTLYDPISEEFAYLVLGIRDFNNDGLPEILILDENMNLRLYGPPDD